MDARLIFWIHAQSCSAMFSNNVVHGVFVFHDQRSVNETGFVKLAQRGCEDVRYEIGAVSNIRKCSAI